MGKLIPIMMLATGLAAGVGAGILLPPETKDVKRGDEAPEGATAHSEGPKAAEAKSGRGDPPQGVEYVKLNNQFVVPVVGNDRVEALVVLSLSLEIDAGASQAVYSREPKLRDAFLQVLFDHSNIGGFQGAFTQSNNLDILRKALREAAQRETGGIVRNVLIVEISRQDV